MNIGKLIYEGKAKKVYETDEPDLLVQEFKDAATAFDAAKKGIIKDKGACNNQISARLFGILEKHAVPTHFVRLLSERQMLVKRLEIVPVEVTVRNIVAGGMSRLLGIEEGRPLKMPVLEYHYKSDALHDPLINDYHILALELAEQKELELISRYSFEVNRVLLDFFARKGLKLVDFKLEFGRHHRQILLGDEISPDTCRLWDAATNKKLDKDRFRHDLGGVEEAYQEVLARVLEM